LGGLRQYEIWPAFGSPPRPDSKTGCRGSLDRTQILNRAKSLTPLRLRPYLGSHSPAGQTSGRMLVRHKYRYGCIAQDIAGSATEDELPQSTLRIGSLDQEVATQCVCVLQNRLTVQAAVEANGQWLCWNAAQLQIVA
jgi:hypothetical protein